MGGMRNGRRSIGWRMGGAACAVWLLASCGGSGSSVEDAGAGDAAVDAGDAGVSEDGGLPPLSGVDETFGEGGLRTVGFPSGALSQLWAVVEQPDGKLVYGGRNRESIFLARTDADGQLDPSFGEGGLAFAALGQPVSSFGTFGDLALDEDGSILVASYVLLLPSGEQRAILLRYLSDGRLDTTFGNDGVVMREEPGGTAFFAAVTVQPDGKILAGGSNSELRLERFLPDGTLDETFDEDGAVQSTLGSEFASVLGLEVRDDGRIVTVGDRSDGVFDPPSVALARFMPDGALDTSFGPDDTGYVIDTVAPGQGFDVALDGEAIVVAGNRADGGNTGRFAVGRFSEDGVIDTSFGDEGWALEEGTRGSATSLALRSDGRIVAAGWGEWDGSPAGVVSFDSGGELDSMFGEGGIGEVVPGMAPQDVALDSEGRAVTVATGMAVRHDLDGNLDTGFGDEGFSRVETSSVDRALAVAVQSDGKVLVGGAGGALGPAGLVRLDADGDLDTTFEGGGLIRGGLGNLQAITAVEVDDSDRVLLGGTSAPSSSGFRVVRLDAMGSLDTTFGEAGIAEEPPLAAGDTAEGATMARAADGSILAAGFGVSGTDVRLDVVRWLDDGTVDPDFGDAGVASVPLEGATTNPSNVALAPHPDGAVVVAGTASLGATGVLARFTSGGVLDEGFNGDGSVAIDGVLPRGLAVDDDGRILLASVGTTPPTVLTVSRYDAMGELDGTFGGDGAVSETLGAVDYTAATMTTPVGLAVAPDGAVKVGAATGQGGLHETAVLFGYTSDGSPDEGFGEGGRLDLPLSTASSSIHALALQPDGRALAAGRAWTPSGGSDFAIVRLQ
ncbi:MAG: hypothetical protein ACOCXM_11645 [Myxococcota bacterium]